MHIILVAGARPNFMKAAPILRALQARRSLPTLVLLKYQTNLIPFSDTRRAWPRRHRLHVFKLIFPLFLGNLSEIALVP